MIKEIIILTALYTIGTSIALAQDWRSIGIVYGPTGKSEVYADFHSKTINSDGTVNIRLLLNGEKPISPLAWSVISERQFDCRKKKSRYVSATFHAGPMGDGKATPATKTNTDWKEFKEDDVLQVIHFKAVC